MTSRHVTLRAAEQRDFPDFKRDLQAAFAVAVVEDLGELPDGPIPSDADLEGVMSAPNAVVLHIMHNDERVGGAVVSIDHETQANALAFLFIAVGKDGQGFGKAAWSAIEAMFPETRKWETATPYFEKRNIHFYVNVCGFHIVEFYHERNPDPHMPASTGDPDVSEMFRFEKQMKHRPC